MKRLTGAGMKPADADALLKGVAIETFQVKKDGEVVKSNAEASFWKGYVMAFLLSMTTMIYGLNVARSIIQEKTSRIFEVMLAIVKPSDMLAGKLIGVGAVGLTQIVIWLVAGAAILLSPFAAAIADRRICRPLLLDRRRALPGLLCARLPALQLAVRRPGRHLRNRAGTADVHAAGRRAHLAQLCADHAGHQRLRIPLVDGRLALSRPPRPSSCSCAWPRRCRRPGSLRFPSGCMIAQHLGACSGSPSRLYRVGILMYGKRATLPELLRWLR